MAIQQLTYQDHVWVNITDPTDTDLRTLREQYPFLSPLNLEDITSIIERPKIDCEDDYLFMILQLPLWDEQMRLTRPYEIDMFVGQRFVITAQDGNFKPLNTLFNTAQQNETTLVKLLGKGGPHTFYLIIDTLVDYIFPILNKIDYNIRLLEERIFSADARILIREIALLRRDIIALQRIIRQLVPVIEDMNSSTEQVFSHDMTDYFDDVVDHIHRARAIIDEDADVVAGLADTADKLLSHRLNNVIRVLTVISVLVLPLNFIAGVYGMNIALPLQDNPVAFFIVVGVMLLITIAMLAFFRFRRWI
ncbi:MAG: magnesium transporter CorA family protein [Chloroflexota bacterium]|nr:magnesium transporter CorA family protein [Chloroflexota bacterium]